MISRILHRSMIVALGCTVFAAGAQAQLSAKPQQAEKQIKEKIQQVERDVDSIVKSMKEAKKARIDAPAPDFTLIDTEGKEHRLSDYIASGKVVVLEWFNPQCPYVREHYNAEGKGTSTTLEKEFAEHNVVWLRINSGSEKSRTSGKELNEQFRKEWKITGPVLLDPEGKVGMAYGAKVTPTMFVITTEGIIAYEGALDSDPSPSKTGEEIYVRSALKSVLAGETVEKKQTKAVGCSVKYAAKARPRG
ncbi:MAG: thioredoxin family protein [Planctomycetota bacterium]|nr:MAG: thioredoxin family protein [Planctomycetota bacterium]